MAIAEILRATASVTIRATAERVFDAWLDPAIASRFLNGANAMPSEFSNDPVEGGAFRIVMPGENGERHEHEGRYVLIERPHRLIFTWVSVGTGERLSLVTVTLKQTSDGVRVDLVHEGLPDDRQAANHARGWTFILNTLAAQLGQED
jgi:uncharacterized protein YndB with AHSA1/START domain